jgi:hypothetical protein
MSFEIITLEIENSQTKVEVSTNNKGFDLQINMWQVCIQSLNKLNIVP